jgi:hypothetical protein
MGCISDNAQAAENARQVLARDLASWPPPQASFPIWSNVASSSGVHFLHLTRLFSACILQLVGFGARWEVILFTSQNNFSQIN